MNGHACLHSCRVQLFKNSCKDFHHSCQTNPVHSRENFKQCTSSSFAFAMNSNFAFTGSNTENPFWYQQFDLRQIRILRRGQPIVNFDAADECRLQVTTMKAMKFQDDIPSIPIDNFKDHYVLVFDLTSMHVITQN